MAHTIIRITLGGALVLALFTAGWKVYQRLPVENASVTTGADRDGAGTELTIVLRLKSPAEHSEFQLALYPLDIQALQREFSSSPHSGKQFEDFLAQRMRGQSPVRAQVDGDGRATLRVAPGSWWIHARLTLADDESAEWRLPVTVDDHKQIVELTTENAYERTKKF